MDSSSDHVSQTSLPFPLITVSAPLFYFIFRFLWSLSCIMNISKKKKGNTKIGEKNEIRPEHTGRTPESENPKRPFQLIKIQKTKT